MAIRTIVYSLDFYILESSATTCEPCKERLSLCGAHIRIRCDFEVALVGTSLDASAIWVEYGIARCQQEQ